MRTAAWALLFAFCSAAYGQTISGTIVQVASAERSGLLTSSQMDNLIVKGPERNNAPATPAWSGRHKCARRSGP
jgi:hypothetical protein